LEINAWEKSVFYGRKVGHAVCKVELEHASGVPGRGTFVYFDIAFVEAVSLCCAIDAHAFFPCYADLLQVERAMGNLGHSGDLDENGRTCEDGIRVWTGDMGWKACSV